MRRLLLPILLLVLSLSACRQAERPEVMSRVSLHLLLPSGESLTPVRESYRIEYHNHNTRLTTTRSSIPSREYTDELYRGLYDIRVEGTLLLASGEAVWVRGSVAGVLLLEPEERCDITLSRMR